MLNQPTVFEAAHIEYQEVNGFAVNEAELRGSMSDDTPSSRSATGE